MTTRLSGQAMAAALICAFTLLAAASRDHKAQEARDYVFSDPRR